MSDLYGNNFSTNNPGMPGDDEKKKKMLLIGGGAVIGVIVILMIVIGLVSSANNQKNNLYIDGSLKSKLTSTSLFYVDNNNVPYIAVEKIAPLLAYEFYNGEYGTGNEDRTHCYVKNAHEIALLEMDSNLVYKTLVKDDSSTFDSYKMSYRVKRNNDMLYISLPTMQKVFNVKYTYNAEKNTLKINTLPALFAKYNTAVKNDGYYGASEEFVNQKALIEDKIVVISKEKQYGVLNLSDRKVIIGTKYPNMTYSEGMGEFIVEAENSKKYGVLVIDAQGNTIVKVGFEYDSLKLIDNSIGLYLVENAKKYGVLDKNGRIIINLEYDKVGLENPKVFATDNIKNSYVLYDNLIPVKQGELWYMFNVLGENKLTRGVYGLGCIVSTSQTAQNVLLIPASEGVEGIVVARKNSTNKIKYGVIDAQGTFKIPDSFDSIYKTTSGGETSYNMLFGNTVIPVSERLKENVSSGSNSGPIQIQ